MEKTEKDGCGNAAEHKISSFLLPFLCHEIITRFVKKLQNHLMFCSNCFILLGFDCTVSLEEEIENDRCEMMMKKIDSDNKGIITDNTPSRLHSTWISQE